MISLPIQIPRPVVGSEEITYRTCTPPSVMLPPPPTSNYVAIDEVQYGSALLVSYAPVGKVCCAFRTSGGRRGVGAQHARRGE